MNPSTDIRFLVELQEGNAEAYDILFLKYYEMLCVNAYFYLRDADEAKELVQAFFVELFEKKGHKQLKGDIKGYLYQSVKNRCLNRIRKLENDQRRSARLKLEYIDHDTVEEDGATDRLYDRLHEALAQLSTQRKEALTLIYMQDKRYQEAADEMGISINSLKTHLKLGLKKLRGMLANFGKA